MDIEGRPAVGVGLIDNVWEPKAFLIYGWLQNE